MPISDSKQLAPCAVERSVKTLVGIVGVGAMFAGLLLRFLSTRLGTRVCCSVGKNCVGDVFSKGVTRVSHVTCSGKYQIEERFLARKQRRQGFVGRRSDRRGVR